MSLFAIVRAGEVSVNEHAHVGAEATKQVHVQSQIETHGAIEPNQTPNGKPSR
jgi:hypothetical protein